MGSEKIHENKNDTIVKEKVKYLEKVEELTEKPTSEKNFELIVFVKQLFHELYSC